MKHSIFTLLIISFVSISCASVQKLVDQGNYDQAIVLATKRLAGKKNKKTKHIKALERAFAKVMENDLARVAQLRNQADAYSWIEAYHIYLNIERRQEAITPFLPLSSKDGYIAHFDLSDVGNEIIIASKNAGELLFKEGIEKLKQAAYGVA